MKKRKKSNISYGHVSSATIRNWTIYRLSGFKALLEEVKINATNKDTKNLAEIAQPIIDDLIDTIKEDKQL
jgi:hypothetical protein